MDIVKLKEIETGIKFMEGLLKVLPKMHPQAIQLQNELNEIKEKYQLEKEKFIAQKS